ncbi:MAG TPA: polysaccharide deacetylase family protein [Chitinophagaceae bacterium]|nr:polysaccharide deacetylase family protein [Chitinophagaceae bacterium]
METGVFTISLDFEIHWGVSDHHTIESYNENLRNVPVVVNKLLNLFKEKQVHATWATVGMLFCRNKEELFSFVKPENRPTYLNRIFSNYRVAEEVGINEQDDPYHFASSLIKEITHTPHQELASHTFSHYYCLEPGQTPEQFFYDLAAAKDVAKREQVEIATVVFPANQFHPDYLQQCRKQGIKCYRGNYPSWIYQFQAKSKEGSWKRMSRLIDTYLPLKGNRYVEAVMEDGILNIPASCFLRPYRSKLSMLEGLRVWRMRTEMKAAAKKKKIYHLWWHPHNFGKNMDKNFSVLTRILDYYLLLNKRYNMQSLTMEEIHNLVSTTV